MMSGWLPIRDEEMRKWEDGRHRRDQNSHQIPFHKIFLHFFLITIGSSIRKML